MTDDDSTAARKKPRAGSVTSEACTCRSLERAAEEPSNPIVFDGQVNEYHLTHLDLAGIGKHGYSVIYHCLFCGGAAPPSKRATLFAHITDTERRRLFALVAGLQTFDEAVAKLGLPDEDFPNGLTTHSPGSETEGPVVRRYRLVRYTRLSETVDVEFVDYGPERKMSMTLHGKYIGPTKPSASDGGRSA